MLPNKRCVLGGVLLAAALLLPWAELRAEPAPPTRFRFRGQTFSGTSAPLSGTPVSLPGMVQAENYDLGGEGIGASDVSPGNAGGRLRNDNVDLTDNGAGGFLLGWTEPGEWLKYTVNVPAAGNYTANFRVASLGQGGSYFLEANGQNVTGTLTVPNTGGWQNWQTVSQAITLSAGRQVLRLVMFSAPNGSVGNFDHFEIIRPVAPPPPPPPASGTLRVITWNTHSGSDANDVDTLTQQVQLMLQQNPDVVTLQEVSLFNGDQSMRFRNEFQRLSGQTWYPAWAPSCLSGGCLGNLILSRLPIEATSTHMVDPTAFGRARIVVNNTAIEFFSAHLGVPTDRRTRELNELMAWVDTFSAPRIVMGDYNSWWGEPWTIQMRAEYHDTWQDVTGSLLDGPTIGDVRFDYIYRSIEGDAALTPTRCYVVDTHLSDHRPVVAEFTVR